MRLTGVILALAGVLAVLAAQPMRGDQADRPVPLAELPAELREALDAILAEGHWGEQVADGRLSLPLPTESDAQSAFLAALADWAARGEQSRSTPPPDAPAVLAAPATTSFENLTGPDVHRPVAMAVPAEPAGRAVVSSRDHCEHLQQAAQRRVTALRVPRAPPLS